MGEQETPEALYSRTWMATVNSFMRVRSFQSLSAEGLKHSIPKLMNEHLAFSEKLFSSPECESMFRDKEGALKALGGHEKSAQQMTTNSVNQYREAVDSAALVFCHSILDNAAFEYCRISALVSPASWETYIAGKQVTLDQVKNASYSDILREKLATTLKSLERESLLFKIDRLFSICKPAKEFSPIELYTYDRKRIEALDESRHRIVHSYSFQSSIPVSEADVEYYLGTANYLMALLNETFDLKIDPEKMLSAFAGPPPSTGS